MAPTSAIRLAVACEDVAGEALEKEKCLDTLKAAAEDQQRGWRVRMPPWKLGATDPPHQQLIH